MEIDGGDFGRRHSRHLVFLDAADRRAGTCRCAGCSCAADHHIANRYRKEAARLQVHRVDGPRYTEPSRNPFRFNAPREPARATPVVVAVEPPPVLPPPPPRITLDGVAADTMDSEAQRTAILNTDTGVVLAKEGDQVAGYRIQKIAADAVELVKIDDGSVLRLRLR